MTDKEDLNSLQREHKRIGLALKELDNFKTQIQEMQRHYKFLQRRLGVRIQDLKMESEPIVSDHAIVRYFQHYEGLDVDEVVKKINQLPREEKVVEYGNTITVGKHLSQDYTRKATK